MLIVGSAALAKEYDTVLHSHVAESKVQAVSALKRLGKSLTAHIGNDYVRVRIGIGHPGRKDLV